MASLNGGLAVAVPLELKGMWMAHRRHGRLPWARLFEPAIALAEHGFPAHPYLGAAGAGARCSRCCCWQRWLLLLLLPARLPRRYAGSRGAAAASLAQLLRPGCHCGAMAPSPRCTHTSRLAPAVASLSGKAQSAALLKWPAIRDTFYLRQGAQWRAPRVNETCCRRPQLAALLRDGARLLCAGGGMALQRRQEHPGAAPSSRRRCCTCAPAAACSGCRWPRRAVPRQVRRRPGRRHSGGRCAGRAPACVLA